jgi:cytochrome c peroxidase
VTCHRPDHGWSNPRRFSTDFAGKPTLRHAPTIINRLFSDRQHWSGLRASLEEQAGLDVNKTDAKVMEHLGTIPAYRREFRAVFGRDFDPDGVAQAIATYVRTILSGDSPYDRFQAGDQRAMSEAAQRGLRLFEGKAMCTRCHAGFNFWRGYRNIGAVWPGRTPTSAATRRHDDPDRGAFKTPTLRDVAARSVHATAARRRWPTWSGSTIGAA